MNSILKTRLSLCVSAGAFVTLTETEIDGAHMEVECYVSMLRRAGHAIIIDRTISSDRKSEGMRIFHYKSCTACATAVGAAKR